MANTFTFIQSYTVSTGSPTTFNLSSIPATYTDLCLRLSLRGSFAGGEDTPLIRFNGDAGSNYATIFASGRPNDIPTGNSSGTVTGAWVGTINGDGDTAGCYSNIEIWIPNYTSSDYKVCYADSGTESMQVAVYQRALNSVWASTAAINQITVGIVSGGYGFKQYSNAYLYGVSKS